jgi:hypothetical protein
VSAVGPNSLDIPSDGIRGDLPGSSDQANRARALFTRESKDFDFDSVKHEWLDRLDQVRALVSAADSDTESPAGFRLTEIDLGLTITAEGHLAFVASASASAVLQVKFTR